MKNILIVLTISTLFYSCKKKDDGSSTPTGTVTDRDGNVYPTVKICDQEWTAKNLNVSTYRNGDPIPQVTDPGQWTSLTTGAWCYYENSSANGVKYGKLYNWYAVNDTRGLAPEGWHIPSDDEWTTLTTCLGGYEVAGGKMKSAANSLWFYTTTGNNSSGFSALPGGVRYSSTGEFSSVGGYASFWSSSQDVYSLNQQRAYARALQFSDNFLYSTGGTSKLAGYSVRCVKD